MGRDRKERGTREYDDGGGRGISNVSTHYVNTRISIRHSTH